MIWNSLMVALGGCFGAVSRYHVSQWMLKRFPSHFPIGTLFVNLSGSFLLGFLIAADWPASVLLLLGTGFMGAFTTFSTLKVESIQLARKKEWRILVIYLGATYTIGVLLAFLGYLGGKYIF
ncbi:fluoride efflux transporter CrcB [Microaerobacter geothermalis]|uniref:fluoride efflux transporter CrcB n=1 Tax=Microaerobacter geothermalis TaxID=674972 RepID=UPI001F33589B|nr:fluoride efflux transporter CrcB [Microaerobacter geothermalis]MCF6093719.1 fluoride efflux transporter CrcB [Microaerobacter geothermalis]